jgi:hypothetical protein
VPDVLHSANLFTLGKLGDSGSERGSKALFRSWKVTIFQTVALSFVFNKYCSIIDQIGSKDPSRDLQLIYAISYLFYQHLMLHACVQKIDVMERE